MSCDSRVGRNQFAYRGQRGSRDAIAYLTLKWLDLLRLGNSYCSSACQQQKTRESERDKERERDREREKEREIDRDRERDRER